MLIGSLKKGVAQRNTTPMNANSTRTDLTYIRTEQERRESLLFENKGRDIYATSWADFLHRQFIGAWFVCTPALVTLGKTYCYLSYFRTYAITLYDIERFSAFVCLYIISTCNLDSKIQACIYSQIYIYMKILISLLTREAH